jgi:hypothetical protein
MLPWIIFVSKQGPARNAGLFLPGIGPAIDVLHKKP